MMARVPLIAAAYHHRAAALRRDGVQVARQRRVSRMVPIAGAQPQADDHRPLELLREAVRVPYPQHDIRLLIGRHAPGHHEKIPEVLLGLLELHHHDIRLRRSSDIGQAVPQPAARGYPRHGGSMAVLVPAGHYAVGIGGLQRPVDVLSGIYGAIVEALRRGAVLNGLIPDCQNPAVPLAVPESLAGIVYPRIDDADDHPTPCQAQRRPLGLGDAADDQVVRVEALASHLPLHQAVQLRHALVVKDVLVHVPDIFPADVHDIIELIHLQIAQVEKGVPQSINGKIRDHVIIFAGKNLVSAVHIRIPFRSRRCGIPIILCGPGKSVPLGRPNNL